MADTASPVTQLGEGRAWDLLASQQIGRLVLLAEGTPEIFPVNYVVDGESIVIRTAAGTKLDLLIRHNRVGFEIDTWDTDHGYCVVAYGTAAPVTDPAELNLIEALRLKPWVPTVKTTFVRIVIHRLSARRFDFGPDPIDKYR